MKELIKPNPLEQEYEEIDRYCDQSIDGCPRLRCICDGGTGNTSISDEEDILF